MTSVINPCFYSFLFRFKKKGTNSIAFKRIYLFQSMCLVWIFKKLFPLPLFCWNLTKTGISLLQKWQKALLYRRKNPKVFFCYKCTLLFSCLSLTFLLCLFSLKDENMSEPCCFLYHIYDNLKIVLIIQCCKVNSRNAEFIRSNLKVLMIHHYRYILFVGEK